MYSEMIQWTDYKHLNNNKKKKNSNSINKPSPENTSFKNFEINFESDKILSFDNSNEQEASFRANLNDFQSIITKNKENIPILKKTVPLKGVVP